MRRCRQPLAAGTLAALCLVLGGCHHTGCGIPAAPEVARELDKTTFPDHVIEPPDVLLITGVRLVPRPPYRLEPLDSVSVRVVGPSPEDSLDGVFVVEADGRLVLGSQFGSVVALGRSTEQVRKAIEDLLRPKLRRFQVFVSLVQTRSLQAITGEHLVQPDGKVDLGTYGSVYVTGLTTDEARAAIEAHLARTLVDPRVTVSVAAYNSKVYYIITDGGGLGEQVFRFPATGNETVLDALSQINGLPTVASRKRIWLARPAPCDDPEQILPIDWKGITRAGKSGTNYQVLPGDRIYVQAKPIVTFDVALARALAPVERLLGITLLANAVVEALQPGISTGN